MIQLASYNGGTIQEFIVKGLTTTHLNHNSSKKHNLNHNKHKLQQSEDLRTAGLPMHGWRNFQFFGFDQGKISSYSTLVEKRSHRTLGRHEIASSFLEAPV